MTPRLETASRATPPELNPAKFNVIRQPHKNPTRGGRLIFLARSPPIKATLIQIASKYQVSNIMFYNYFFEKN